MLEKQKVLSRCSWRNSVCKIGESLVPKGQGTWKWTALWGFRQHPQVRPVAAHTEIINVARVQCTLLLKITWQWWDWHLPCFATEKIIGQRPPFHCFRQTNSPVRYRWGAPVYPWAALLFFRNLLSALVNYFWTPGHAGWFQSSWEPCTHPVMLKSPAPPSAWTGWGWDFRFIFLFPFLASLAETTPVEFGAFPLWRGSILTWKTVLTISGNLSFFLPKLIFQHKCPDSSPSQPQPLSPFHVWMHTTWDSFADLLVQAQSLLCKLAWRQNTK